jgi:hypothetical protein
MKAHILSAFPGPPLDPNNYAFLWLKESAKQDPFGRHQLTEDAKEADIILFVENHTHDAYLLSVRHHPVYRAFSSRSLVYHDDDFAVPVLRGLYPSIRRRDYMPDRCRAAGYIARVTKNDSICYDPARRNRKWLYSFMGEANSTVRLKLLSAVHTEGFVRDTTGARLWQMAAGPARDHFTREYAQSILDSEFILCPAGYGPSTYRLFEAMEMGRVPVILSDEWVPPQGPAWSDFSLQIPERDADAIPSILRTASANHEKMGLLARRAWEQWFAKPVCFDRLIELCSEIQKTPMRTWSTLCAWTTLLRKPHLETYMRSHYYSAANTVRSKIKSHFTPR